MIINNNIIVSAFLSVPVMLEYKIMSFYRGCLLVRQSFFHNDPKNFADVGGGVLGCRGFHSSFRTTQSGLSLNIGSICCLPWTLYWFLIIFLNSFLQFV